MPKNTQQGFGQILVLTIIVLLVGGGAYYFGKNSQSTPATSQTTPAPSPTPTLDETANWEMYKDSNYSVKYPSGFEIKHEGGSTIYLMKYGPTQKEGTEVYDGVVLRFEPKEISNTTAETLARSYVEETERQGGEVLEQPQSITISNYKGVTYTTRGLGINKNIILQGPNSMFIEIIDSTSDPTKQGFNELANQILSTFKFTE